MNIETIHDNLVNGQRRQMVKQIEEYGVVDFFGEYQEWLKDWGKTPFGYFEDATISYFRIIDRG